MSFVGLQLKPFSFTQRYVGLLFSVCVLALVTGCEQAKRPQEAGSVAKKVEETRVTLAEAEKFAKEYLSAIDRRNTNKIQELIYWDALVDRIFKDLPNNSVRREYETSSKKILSKFAKGIKLETGDGGNYGLLRIVLRGKDRHVIFRLVTGSASPVGGGRLNYHNLRLVKHRGKVRADDIYVARMGAWMSETYRTAIQPVLLQSQRSPVGFTSQQQKEMDVFLLMAKMSQAAQMGKHAEASKIYEELPEDLQKSKNVMSTRMLVPERDEFFKAADAMLEEYPGSPAVGLRLMDFGMKNRDLPTLQRAGEALAKWTTGDSYIDLNIAALLLKMEKVDEAVELSKDIDVRDWDFKYPVVLKYNIALAAKDNETILECLRIFRDNYDDDIKAILKTEACKDFIVSLEYIDLKNEGFTPRSTGR